MGQKYSCKYLILKMRSPAPKTDCGVRRNRPVFNAFCFKQMAGTRGTALSRVGIGGSGIYIFIYNERSRRAAVRAGQSCCNWPRDLAFPDGELQIETISAFQSQVSSNPYLDPVSQ